MKLKSLLLGSAAALALSTGAQAADPIVEFVSLGVCDAYGITGLTIESDDTCLKISGNVSYEYRIRNVEAASPLSGIFAPGTEYDAGAGVEWQLLFEATTQTDGGPAKAVLRLNDVPGSNGGDVRIERAFVSFGDTTVLSAGRIGSLFSTTILEEQYGSRHEDFIDFWNFDDDSVSKSWLTNTVRTGGMGIQVESLIADGFSVLVALEDLEQVAIPVPPVVGTDYSRGTFGLAVAYDANGIEAEAGILIGDLYDNMAGYDPINYYINAKAEFDNFNVRGGFIIDDSSDWVASLGADATFDMFSIKGDVAFDDDGWFAGVEGSVAATDTIDVILGATFEEDFTLVGDSWSVYGGVNADVTETVVARAQIGYIESNGSDLVYGEVGVVYAPGGRFETGLDLTATTEGDYQVTFSASKAF